MIRSTTIACTIVAAFAMSLTAQSEPQRLGPQIVLPRMKSLTVTGEYRVRYENFWNYDLDSKIGDNNDVFTQRVRLNFEAQISDRLSAFVQFQDVRNWGEEMPSSAPGSQRITTTDDSADGLDIHQGWAQLQDVPGIGGWARVGRQVLSFGDERLVGALEWSSQGRAFDGYRHTWQEEDLHTIDVFLTQVKERLPATPVYDDAYFGGIYATVDTDEEVELDFYLLFLRDDETAIVGGTENRTTLGMRWEQVFGNLEAGIELATQTGKLNGADIPFGKTYAAHVHAELSSDRGVRPWARIEINAASGDDPSSADNERFKNLFPTAHAHWGMMDFALWENMRHGAVQIGIRPDAKSRISLTWHVFETDEETDRFVGPAGRISPNGGATGDSNSIGNEVDILYRVDFDSTPAETWVEAGYGIFLPGSGARAVSTDGDTAHFFYLMTGIRF